MTIENYVARTKTGIGNLGFLFGAGTSFESGYPLVAGLTNEVIKALPPSEREILDEVLLTFGHSYDEAICAPNIEEISDMVIEHHTNSQLPRIANLKERIRDLVRDAILSVENPDISNQVSFFERLQARAFDRATDVWIFTTNYDLLLENACAEVGLKIINGFVGATTRYFAEREFVLVSGTTTGARFSQENGLTVRIIKLHGSVSWYRRNGKLLESSPSAISDSDARFMVLPRRTKVIETMSPPYDRLFHTANMILGDKCRHLISSGFSFADGHINDNIVIPKVASGAISFTNFCLDEPSSLFSLRKRPNVHHICKDKIISGGRETETQNNSWKFSEFAKLF